jgi:ATP-dependent Clp protease ATP-binding subunit ClpA
MSDDDNAWKNSMMARVHEVRQELKATTTELGKTKTELRSTEERLRKSEEVTTAMRKERNEIWLEHDEEKDSTNMLMEIVSDRDDIAKSLMAERKKLWGNWDMRESVYDMKADKNWERKKERAARKMNGHDWELYGYVFRGIGKQNWTSRFLLRRGLRSLKIHILGSRE